MSWDNMSDSIEFYCRLCAELTPKSGLISAEEDVAISSRIATKMLWINVDISSSSILPHTICFSCFDMLERTWNFLHTVRAAQEKLNGLFIRNDASVSNSSDAGKPVDENWEQFQDTKKEVKDDPEGDVQEITTVDPSTLLNMDLPIIKIEHDSDNVHYSGMNSSDCDAPLKQTKKKRKIKKKKKVKNGTEVFEEDLISGPDSVTIDINAVNMSWDDYMYRCASCDALCKNIMSLRLHSLQIHSSCCAFKCMDCGRVISSFKSFVNHVRLHQKILRYCCEFCNKHFALTAYLKKHCLSTHAQEILNSCRHCGAVFESEELLRDHLLIYGKGYTRNRRRQAQREARREARKEVTDSDLKCEHCFRVFKSKSNLTQHKLIHTERSRDFACHVCGKMFYTKGSLGTHMAIHKEEKPYKCDLCPMAFSARGNLQSHISLHSGSKPFVCEQCGKSFRVKRHLKSHSIVHTDLMPYICEFCNKSFRFKTRLNLHLRQHTGAKPYTCVFCQRDFTNGSNYKKHMKRRHNIDTSRKKYNNVATASSEVDNGEINNDSKS